MRKPGVITRLSVHTAVYALAASMLLPFLWMILTSLKSDQETLGGATSLLPRGLPWEWRWGNYAEALVGARLGEYYFNSLLAAGLTTLLAGFHNAAAGYAFCKLRFRGRRGLLWITLVTMMLPIQVSFIFMYLIADRLGFIDNMQALVVPFLASGFGIYYMQQAINAVPDSLLEAGRLDGMTELDLFWLLVRPTIWPAVSALAIFTFVGSWNSFFWPLIAIDRSQEKTLPLAVAELATGMLVLSWPTRMAAATLITLPLIIVFVIFQRSFVRGIAMTGGKE
ncbi:MAG TPA: carbohydrate ABC transporter permease [Phycisphaerales bacterium]|nr:carbohydrate ABC transporter permease [Phycisphaerales bacterium]